jgi:hypothetical protein
MRIFLSRNAFTSALAAAAAPRVYCRHASKCQLSTVVLFFSAKPTSPLTPGFLCYQLCIGTQSSARVCLTARCARSCKGAWSLWRPPPAPRGGAGLLTTASKEDTLPRTECEYSERRYFCNALTMNGAERRRYYCNALPASHTLVS